MKDFAISTAAVLVLIGIGWVFLMGVGAIWSALGLC